MKNLYKKRYKRGNKDIIIPAAFFIAICIYYITGNVNLFLPIFALCIILAILYFSFKVWRKQKRLLKSGILEIDKMPGEKFEEYILACFKSLGYDGYVTRGSQDYGADIVIEKNRCKTVIQSKRWSQKVSVDAVQQIAAAVRHYKAHKAIVITNNYFTANAKKLALSNNVELWDRNSLIKVLSEKKKHSELNTYINNEIKKDSDNVCPQCGKVLSTKSGRYGNFIGCSGYPDCKYTRSQ